jgi:hypothetical protein
MIFTLQSLQDSQFLVMQKFAIFARIEPIRQIFDSTRSAPERSHFIIRVNGCT